MQEALSGLAVDYGIVSKKATKVQIKESVLNVAVQLLEHVTYIHTYIYIYIYLQPIYACAGLGQHGMWPASGTGFLCSPEGFPKLRVEAWIECDDCNIHIDMFAAILRDRATKRCSC